MRKDWDKRKNQLIKEKKKEQEGEYKLPPALKALSILTQVVILLLCLNYIAGLFVDDTPVLSSYKAEVIIDMETGRNIRVSDTFSLPKDSDGATGFTRYIPDYVVDDRGEGSRGLIQNIAATVDNIPLIKFAARDKVDGYLTFGQEETDEPVYGKTLTFKYDVTNGVRTKNVARYATVQLLNKRLGIGADLVQILVYFPQEVSSPSNSAQLYVRSKEEPDVKLVAKGKKHARANNIVEISLKNLDIKRKDVFLKLTWFDFRDPEALNNTP